MLLWRWSPRHYDGCRRNDGVILADVLEKTDIKGVSGAESLVVFTTSPPINLMHWSGRKLADVLETTYIKRESIAQ